MAFKLTIDKLEDVEEQHRALYVEKDGKFHLDVEGAVDPSALTAAQKALKAANDEAAKRRKQLDQWETVGKTPAEIIEMLKQADDEKTRREEEEQKKRGEWDGLRAQMNETHQKAIKVKDDVIAAKDSELTKLRQRLEQQFVDTAAIAAITAEKGLPELLMPAVRNSIKVTEGPNGILELQVVDTKGEPRVNGKGEPLTLAELVSEMRGSDIYGRAFEGSGASGSGSQPPGGKPPPGNITRKSEFKNEHERSQYVEKYGLDAYKRLPL